MLFTRGGMSGAAARTGKVKKIKRIINKCTERKLGGQKPHKFESSYKRQRLIEIW